MWPVNSLIPSFRYLAFRYYEAICLVIVPIPDLLNRSHLVEIPLFHKALEN